MISLLVQVLDMNSAVCIPHCTGTPSVNKLVVLL